MSMYRKEGPMRMIEARSKEIIDKWCEYFGEINYYC